MPLMATSNSPTFGQSNSPRQDGQIISFLVCLVLASFLGKFSLAFLDFLNRCLASEARQAARLTLVGKHGWEVWGCGQAGRFASLSTCPCRSPAYPSSRVVLTVAFGLLDFWQNPKSRQNPKSAILAFSPYLSAIDGQPPQPRVSTAACGAYAAQALARREAASFSR